jgi:hypothetical protein
MERFLCPCKIRKVCKVLGAAPAHPDWLEKRHPLSVLEACVDDYHFKKAYLPELMPPDATKNERLRT